VTMQIDKRLWYVIGAVVLIILIAYNTGYIGGGGETEVAPTAQEAPMQEAPAQEAPAQEAPAQTQ